MPMHEIAQNIVVTGATGYLGRKICASLVNEGHLVTGLSRHPMNARKTMPSGVKMLVWGELDDSWRQAIASANVVIHLAGESVASKKWTPEVKERIRASRIHTTHQVVSAMQGGRLISASAIGYYGARDDSILMEDAAPGKGFLAEVCTQWEQEANSAKQRGVDVTVMRIGIVLGKDGGALPAMLHPFSFPFNPWACGLGGPLGSGMQWMSWIHVDDLVSLFCEVASKNIDISGVCNVTAPHPVRNREFTQTLAAVLHRPALVPMPAFALHAILGEFADSLLNGQRAMPGVALAKGFQFKFPSLQSALQNILVKS